MQRIGIGHKGYSDVFVLNLAEIKYITIVTEDTMQNAKIDLIWLLHCLWV